MRAPRPRDLFQLSLLYLPMTLFWTAMQLQLLPQRIEVLAGSQKGLGLAWVGSIGALAATLCIFLVGPLSDHTTHPRGRRYPWVVGGIGVGVVGALLFAAARSLPVLLLAFVLARLGFASAVAAYEAILPDRVPLEFRGRAAGWSELCDIVGQLAGVLLTGLLVAGAINVLFHQSLPREAEAHLAISVICGGSALALLGVLLLNLSWIRGPRLSPEQAMPMAQAVRLAWSWRPSQAPDFFALYLSRCVLNLGTLTGVEFLHFYVAETLPMQGTDIAHEVMMIGLCFTAGGVAGALSGGWLGDTLSKRTLLWVFGSIATLAAIGFCLTASIPQARLFAVLFGVGYSAINTLDWAFATAFVPRGEEARYLSIFQTCFYLPQVVVMGVGGVIGQHLGYRALFWTIPFSLIAGLLLLRRVREPAPPKPLPAESSLSEPPQGAAA